MASPASKSLGRFTWIPHPDNAQKVLLAICTFDLAFFCYYLFKIEMDQESTISDTLFADGGYRVMLTVLLACRLTGAALFFLRFRFKHSAWEKTGYAGLALAFLGWMWLTYHRDNTQHFIGVGVFCAGSFAYSMALVRLAATSTDDKELLHACMDGTLLLCVVMLVVSFVLLWVEEEQSGLHNGSGGGGITKENRIPQSAYLVEHGAYIAQVVFYMLFFLYHSPNKINDMDGYIGGEEYEGVSGTPMVCRPLIPSERILTVIRE